MSRLELPERGDLVEVTFRGYYSNQGAEGTSQFHVIVPEGKAHVQASVPPDAEIKVKQKAVPPEPHPRAIVRGPGDLGATYVYSRLVGAWCSMNASDPSQFLSWDEVWQKHNGNLRIYMPAAWPDAHPFTYVRQEYSVQNVVTGLGQSIWVRSSPVDGDGVEIGSARFTKGDARDLALRILATIGVGNG